MATKKPTSRAPSSEKTSDDVVLVHGRSEDGKALAVVRKRGNELSAGVLRVVEEGKPIHGELVKLSPRAESPALCDVQVLHAPTAAPSVTAVSAPETNAEAAHASESGRSGPPSVASTEYRSGWEAIWGQDRSKRAGPEGRAFDPRLN